LDLCSDQRKKVYNERSRRVSLGDVKEDVMRERRRKQLRKSCPDCGGRVVGNFRFDHAWWCVVTDWFCTECGVGWVEGEVDRLGEDI